MVGAMKRVRTSGGRLEGFLLAKQSCGKPDYRPSEFTTISVHVLVEYIASEPVAISCIQSSMSRRLSIYRLLLLPLRNIVFSIGAKGEAQR